MIGKKDKVERIRNYLNTHVGVIDMQLISQKLKGVSLDTEERQANDVMLMDSIGSSAGELKDVRGM